MWLRSSGCLNSRGSRNVPRLVLQPLPRTSASSPLMSMGATMLRTVSMYVGNGRSPPSDPPVLLPAPPMEPRDASMVRAAACVAKVAEGLPGLRLPPVEPGENAPDARATPSSLAYHLSCALCSVRNASRRYSLRCVSYQSLPLLFPPRPKSDIPAPAPVLSLSVERRAAVQKRSFERKFPLLAYALCAATRSGARKPAVVL
mmetsp:Transcript_1224/g.2834  ORF Transcript_1224/g.2834 Transcript_1224/m.2834 type:complete len:202 (-) Transcript_1224:104-709(-)